MILSAVKHVGAFHARTQAWDKLRRVKALSGGSLLPGDCPGDTVQGLDVTGSSNGHSRDFLHIAGG